MTPRLLPACATAAVGIALLAGCTPLGSGAGASSSATPTTEPTTTVLAEAPAGTPDPCALVTAEELGEDVGIKMAAGKYNSALSNSGRNICEWRPANEERSEPRVQIEINWGFPSTAEHRALAEEVFDKTLDVTRKIGDITDAYTTPSRHTLGMSVDEYFVKISYIAPNASRKVAGNATIEIARDVYAALSS
ncbi:DUF3558 family protein [Demequina subtropica]|uniref:DUF3558 family protein n=1 Tax=Demequina subtropica TaxID=1638989 RepID=UPI0007820013|nr:DUF3558 family protein [Demequina subtropica]